MSSLILVHLLIISTIGFIVQSAPTNITKRSTLRADTEKQRIQKHLESILFPRANSLKTEAQTLNHTLTQTGLKLCPSPQIDISDNTKALVIERFHHFSNRCQDFTTAMTFKHQLQDQLFNNVNLSSNHTKRLSKMLTSLQTMADIFDEMQCNKNDRRCVRLTPAQYNIMYYLQYDNTSLLESLKPHMDRWYLAGYYNYPDVRL